MTSTRFLSRLIKKGEEKEEDFNMGTSIQDLRLRSRVWEFRKKWNYRKLVVPLLNLVKFIENTPLFIGKFTAFFSDSVRFLIKT